MTMHPGSPAGADEKVMMVPDRVLSADVTLVDLNWPIADYTGWVDLLCPPRLISVSPFRLRLTLQFSSFLRTTTALPPARLTTSRSSRLYNGF